MLSSRIALWRMCCSSVPGRLPGSGLLWQGCSSPGMVVVGRPVDTGPRHSGTDVTWASSNKDDSGVSQVHPSVAVVGEWVHPEQVSYPTPGPGTTTLQNNGCLASMGEKDMICWIPLLQALGEAVNAWPFLDGSLLWCYWFLCIPKGFLVFIWFCICKTVWKYFK